MKIYRAVRIDMETGETIYEDSYKYEGPVAECKGGGTGALAFPYSEWDYEPTGRYSEWVAEIADYIAAIQESDSPYYGLTPPDPEDYLGSTAAGMAQKELNDHFTLIEALDADADFNTFFENAIAEADKSASFPAISIASDVSAIHTAERSAISSAIDAALSAAADAVAGTPISGMVTAYENKIKKQYLRAMARLASSMADINAVNSSAFIFGMASINRQLIESINQYAATLDLETYKQYSAMYIQAFTTTFQSHLAGHVGLKQMREQSRDRSILVGFQNMMQYNLSKSQMNFTATHLQTELSRIRYQSQNMEFDKALDLDVRDSVWDLTLYTHGANMLASSGGAALVPDEMSPAQQVMSGALTGASIGASVGGPLGAGIGAGLGALVSAFL